SPAALFGLYEGPVTGFFEKENISLYVLEHDSLRFWTSNRVPLESAGKFPDGDNGIVHLRNGWYEYLSAKVKNFQTLAVILVKPEFDVQNKYLSNAFPAWLNMPAAARLKYPVTNPENAVKSASHQPLFEIGLEGGETAVKSETISLWSAILFFSSLLLALLFAVRASLAMNIGLNRFVAGSLLLLGVRTLMIWLKWPGLLYHIPLYDVSTYANSDWFMNGFLGDILINVLLLFAWAFVFYKKISFKFGSEWLWGAALLALGLFMTFLAFELNAIIKSLVTNSTISFEFLNFFNLNSLSFFVLGIVFFYGFALLLLLEKWMELFAERHTKKRLLVLTGFLLTYFLTDLLFLRHQFGKFELLWFLCFFIFTFALHNFELGRNILGIGLRILLFSLITSWLFGKYSSINQEKTLELLSEELTDRADPNLENAFGAVDRKIRSDQKLSEAVRHSLASGNELEQNIRRNYFTGYFEKYNIQLAMFDSLCMPRFKNSEALLNNNDFFESQIHAASTIPTLSEDLFFIEGFKPNSRYIARISFGNTTGARPSHDMYVLIEPKKLGNSGSFPELLLNKNLQRQSKFPYAIYRQNKLVSDYGDFEYPLYFNSREKLALMDPSYTHHFFQNDQVILSTRTRDLNYYFTTNSYYFLFYSVLAVVLFIGYYLLSGRGGLFFSLNRRMQFFIVGMLFFALSAVGIISVRLVAKKFEEDRVKELVEGAQRINTELSTNLFNVPKLDAGNTLYAEALLKKYAALFDSDISVYDKSGYLYASSRPQLFDQGFSSRCINPMALARFKRDQLPYFSTRDNIGSLNYMSLYTMVYNPSGTLLGYMNLPYFARQSDLEKELSDYLTTLLNVYVVLFLVSLFTGLIVTAYITKPLRIVQEQLAKISFNKKNEPIRWASNDEIGQLVNEYNGMLLKLEESANLLARSEREGAWREMARQVAHEIKNPLTPMKLNLQYLQRIVGEDSVNFEEKFKGVSSSIIEQIDTLAHIAGEFSNFAQMPKVLLQPVNLTDTIAASIQTFKNEGMVDITLQSFSEQIIVTADKEQCLRVFNNLIKNAIQAIPDERKGLIAISISDAGEFVTVAVKDNGSGIPEDMKQKIFVPNFTTKSTGTGLGLAMVKNIVSSFSGEIWFESEEEKGSTFFVRLKKA
ncbi:MAG: sensor histidine kinase, partial [Bacteroidia bacterium]